MKLKKKIAVSAVLLLVCLVLVVTATYAWFTVSRLPEVSGIETNVGANGTLEIALLNNETYLDPSKITTTVGGSLTAQEATVSNLQWGNVIDLSDPAYGLEYISLIPAQLNFSVDGEGNCTVNQSMLAPATFGADGRVSVVEGQSVSAVYNKGNFIFSSLEQSYGVRAVGNVSGMTAQQTALATARSSVVSYRSAAASQIKTAWASPSIGKVLLELCHRHYAQGDNAVSMEELYAISGMAVSLNTAYGYVDSALRQGVIGYAAAYVAEEQDFQTLRSLVENGVIPLSYTLDMAGDLLPDSLKNWVTGEENTRIELVKIIRNCQTLIAQGGCTWDQVEVDLRFLLDPAQTYFGDGTLSNVTGTFPEGSTQLLLRKNSGAAGEIASFAGEYQLYISCGSDDQTLVEVRALSEADPPYLAKLSTALESLTAAGGEEFEGEAPLLDIYGYAVDLAFRCNTATQLLLQTAPALRVDEGNDSLLQTQGSGSYMRFSSDTLTTEQLVLMMDAVRVGLMDNQNRLVALAKLNTSNYVESEDGVTAYLYLYDFTPSIYGDLVMGERREDDNVVMDLPESTATILTAVVWLDGVWVDNSLAAATVQSVNGTLNLQFASSADLVSAEIPIS